MYTINGSLYNFFNETMVCGLVFDYAVASALNTQVIKNYATMYTNIIFENVSQVSNNNIMKKTMMKILNIIQSNTRNA